LILRKKKINLSETKTENPADHQNKRLIIARFGKKTNEPAEPVAKGGWFTKTPFGKKAGGKKKSPT